MNLKSSNTGQEQHQRQDCQCQDFQIAFYSCYLMRPTLQAYCNRTSHTSMNHTPEVVPCVIITTVTIATVTLITIAVTIIMRIVVLTNMVVVTRVILKSGYARR